MLTTTFKLLRVHHACTDRYAVLRNAYKRGDNEPITLVEILDSNGLEDALWALRAVPDEQADERDRLARLFACWCVRQVWHLLTDERSRTAVEVSERYAVGAATQDELNAAAAYAAADAARAAYAHAAARAAAYAAARDAYAAALAALAASAAAHAAYAYAAAGYAAQAAKFLEMFG